MIFAEITPDAWWKKYETASIEKQYELVKQTLEFQLSDEFLKNIDFIEIILELYDYFLKRRQYDKLLAIQDLLEKQESDEIKKDSHYINALLLEIYLFKNDIDMVKKYMAVFINDPVKSIDTLISIFNKIFYYNVINLAVHISKELYHQVKDSNELLEGSEALFGRVMIMNEFQNCYKSNQNGDKIDKKEFNAHLKAFDFTDLKGMNYSYSLLTTDNQLLNIDFSEYNISKNKFIEKLLIGFCKYVYDHKNINFITAFDIWLGIWSSFLQDVNQTNHFFKLNQKVFNQKLQEKLELLSNKKNEAFTIVWGTPYVYDFLRLNQLIHDEPYFDAINYINFLKMNLVEKYGDTIWMYNFVHSWTKPDSIDDESFNKEKEYFEKTFYEKIDSKQFLPEEYYKTKKALIKEEKNVNTIKNTINIGRNDPCPCGSGKKYKKCCLNKEN